MENFVEIRTLGELHTESVFVLALQTDHYELSVL